MHQASLAKRSACHWSGWLELTNMVAAAAAAAVAAAAAAAVAALFAAARIPAPRTPQESHPRVPSHMFGDN